MTNKLTISDPSLSGELLYYNIETDAATIYNGADLVAYVLGDIGTYAQALTEQTKPGRFTATFPALVASFYLISIYAKSGASPASDDALVGQVRARWDGTAFDEGVTFSDLGTIDIDLSGVEAEIAAINGKITSQTINIIDPTRLSGAMSIVMGDDYKAADSRALTWMTSTAAMWPDLTGASIKLIMQRNPRMPDEGVESLEQAGEVVTATGSSKCVQVQLTNVQTFDLCGSAPGVYSYKYRLMATLLNDDIITLASGQVAVLEPAIFTPES